MPPLHLLGFYGFFYGFGWLLYHHHDLLGRIAGWWGLYLAAGLGIVLPTLVFLLVPAARAATGQGRVAFDLLGRGL